MTTMKISTQRTITALVEDKPGVLNRVTSLFRRRGFNIGSLAVGPSEVPGLSRITFIVDPGPGDVEQVTKQLFKLIDVIKVVDVTDAETVTREMALVKVKAEANTRSEIIQIIEIFRADILDVSPESIILEVTGDSKKVDAIIELLRGFGIMEVMRTGLVAMTRGKLGPLTSAHHNGTGPKSD